MEGPTATPEAKAVVAPVAPAGQSKTLYAAISTYLSNLKGKTSSDSHKDGSEKRSGSLAQEGSQRLPDGFNRLRMDRQRLRFL